MDSTDETDAQYSSVYGTFGSFSLRQPRLDQARYLGCHFSVITITLIIDFIGVRTRLVLEFGCSLVGITFNYLQNYGFDVGFGK